MRSCSGVCVPDEREVGAHGKGECGGDDSGLPSPVPGADHDGHPEQGKAAFGDIGEQNRGNQRQRRTEHRNPVAQDRRTRWRNAE